jgi:hypothetical protein
MRATELAKLPRGWTLAPETDGRPRRVIRNQHAAEASPPQPSTPAT